MIEQTYYDEQIYEDEENPTKYIVSTDQEVSLDREDLLGLAERKKMEIEQANTEKKKLNKLIKENNTWLKKYDVLLKEAKKAAAMQYCRKCGMDLDKEPEMRVDDQDLCKNCFKAEGVV